MFISFAVVTKILLSPMLRLLLLPPICDKVCTLTSWPLSQLETAMAGQERLDTEVKRLSRALVKRDRDLESALNEVDALRGCATTGLCGRFFFGAPKAPPPQQKGADAGVNRKSSFSQKKGDVDSKTLYSQRRVSPPAAPVSM